MVFEGLLGFFNKIFFFTGYVSGGDSFPPPLSEKEEAEQIRLAKLGDEKAKETLIRHNLRLVAHIVKKFRNAGETDDLISIGSIGLIKAINGFEYGKNARLATFVARCVENEILMYIRAKKKLKNNVSLYESVGRDKEGNELEIVDLLYESEDDVYRAVHERLQAAKLNEIIEKTLQSREREIIKMRYGLMGERAFTQKEVSELLGISRSYVSRIEKKAVEKLRGVITKGDF